MGEGPVRAKLRRPSVFLQLGTEANEAAIKLARLHTPSNATRSSHLKAAFMAERWAPFRPPPSRSITKGSAIDGRLRYAPFGDLAAVKRLIDDETAAS